MRMAFVFPPFSYKLHEENLRVVQKFFGLFPPLSMCWAAGIAKQAGHEPAIIDARTIGLSKRDTLARLKEFKPDILGYMMTTYMFRETLGWIEHAKSALNVPVVIGGYNLRVYPKESVQSEAVDYGVVNSALVTLPELLKQLEGPRDFSSVPGLVYKIKGKPIVNPPPSTPEQFHKYPMPMREGLPHEIYEEFPTEQKNFTVMVTSKGCPRHCLFCEAGGTSYDPRDPEQVVDEIEDCYNRFGIREIDIFDYEFPLHRKRIASICQLIIDRKLRITWACRSRIDSVDEDLIRLMVKAGCNRIYFGIESGVQSILDEVNKGITLRQIEEVIHMVKYYGIRPLGFFLVGAPGETRETFFETFEFAKKLKLDYVQFSKCTAKPLTGLWKKMVEDAGYDYWREYILGNVAESALPRPWTMLSNAEIDSITRWAYIRYHARPSFLLSHIRKIRSFGEFKRKFMGFIDMCFKQESVSEQWTKKNQPFDIYRP